MARGTVARLRRQDRFFAAPESEPRDTAADRLVRAAIWRYVTPRWRRHLEQTIEREGGVDAVIVFTVPMAHLRGIPTALRERFGIPVVYYDGDVPMSLPEHGGTDTSGFNYYLGADPSEYDLVVGNSEGALDRLRALGARRAEAIHWAADPKLFHPHDVEKEMDVFFYGHSDKFRREWMRELVGEPSRRLEDADFALGGRDYPRRRRSRPLDRARAVQRLPAHDLFRADQPQRDEACACGDLCVLDRTAVRARRLRSGDRLEPDRGNRAVVRARPRPPASSPGRTRPSRHTASCSGTPRRRRSWGGEHVSGCWTSTRTLTVHAGCSGSSDSEPTQVSVSDTVVAPVPSPPGLAGLRRIAIVPALNEADTLPLVIDELRAFDAGLDIVVVDDGSTDGTAAAAEAKGAVVLRLPFNLGIGGAVQTGFRYAYEHDYDLAVRVDGDGQHDPAQLGRVLEPVLARRGRHRRRLALRRRANGLSFVAHAARGHTAACLGRVAHRRPAGHGYDLGLSGSQPARDRAVLA